MVSKVVTTHSGQISIKPSGYSNHRKEYYAKATDEKPIEGVNNADILYEMDTHKVYLFNEDDKVWLEQ